MFECVFVGPTSRQAFVNSLFQPLGGFEIPGRRAGSRCIFVRARTGESNMSLFAENAQSLRQHPRYVMDWTDLEDQTYRTFAFALPRGLHPLSRDWDSCKASELPAEIDPVQRFWLLTQGLANNLCNSDLGFAEALRHFIDKLSCFSPVCPGDGAAEAASACFFLASLNVGALVVCCDATHGHGHAMSLRCSWEVLSLVFDPNSPTHDGAVLLQGDTLVACRAFRAASQELASAEILKDPLRGSRHFAAQCISYKLGFLVVVVSEERGTVSIAEAGSLRPCASFAELAVVLREALAHPK